MEKIRIKDKCIEDQIKAVSEKPHMIGLIPNPDTSVQLAAVRKNPMALGHIYLPSKEVVAEALRGNLMAIVFVDTSIIISMLPKDYSREEFQHFFELLEANDYSLVPLLTVYNVL